jgi:hypothetical protein
MTKHQAERMDTLRNICRIAMLALAPVLHASATEIAEIRSALAESDSFAKIRAFADILLDEGRDRYGEVHSPLFPNQLHVLHRRIPTDEETPYWPIEKAQRNPGMAPYMSNFHFNVALIRLLDLVTFLTTDSRYQRAVTEYVDYIQSHAIMTIRGNDFWVGGAHAGWNLHTDKAEFNWHEMRGLIMPWERFHRINAASTQQMIDNLHLHITNPNDSYRFNRHYFVNYSVSLPSSGGVFLHAWSFLHAKTGEQRYLDWAKRMSSLYWFNRSPHTGLPSTKGEYGKEPPRETLGGEPVRTFVQFLLRSSRMLDPDTARVFAYQAHQYCMAYIAATPAEGFVSDVYIDSGKPLHEPVTDIWLQPARLLQMAVTLAYAAQLLGDKEILDFCIRMGDAILPAGSVPEVTNEARHVAMAIEFFRRMYQLTANEDYRRRANAFTALAWQHFHHNGMFMSRPGSDIYSAYHGSAMLAIALLQWEFTSRGWPVFWDAETSFEL